MKNQTKNQETKQSIPWTQFWDMNSGGGQKEDWETIYIQAPEDQAKVIFYNRFGHNPDRVTCTCCGNDYSITEKESLEQLTGYHRIVVIMVNNILKKQKIDMVIKN